MDNLSLLFNLDDWLIDIEMQYGIPALSLDEFIILGQRVMNIYSLSAKNSTFEDVCSYMYEYVQTDIGKRILSKL